MVLIYSFEEKGRSFGLCRRCFSSLPDGQHVKASLASESALLCRHFRRKGADGIIFTLSHKPVQTTLRSIK